MPSDWDAVLDLLDDLELQAEGLHLAERAAEVDALSVAEYAEVPLAARLHASTGLEIHARLADDREVRGRLARVGSDWFLVEQARTAWFVHLSAVVVLTGLDPRSVPESARPLSARLSLRSVLRRLAEERQACAVQLRGGRAVHGALQRVGADFVELRADDAPEAVVVPLSAVAVVRCSGRP
ncbi:hypothetical protein ACVW00_001203 [Marmoricola sp. URHA0025 HA25]